MAQGKVTDFFSVRKRKPDLHPSKRQKLRQSGDLRSDYFAKGNGDLNTELIDGSDLYPNEGAKESELVANKSISKLNKSSRQCARLKQKSKPKDAGKQFSLKSSFSHSEVESDKANQTTNSKLPTKETFEFRLNTVLPSDCDSIVTEYDTQSSPHSTPSKRTRSNTLEKSQAVKRKRKAAEPACTPQSQGASIDELLRAKPTPTRKKLEMPTFVSEASQAGTEASQAGTDASQDEANVVKDISPPSSSSSAPTPTSAVSSSGSPANLKAMIAKCDKLADLKPCSQKVQTLSKEVKQMKESKSKAPSPAASDVEIVQISGTAYKTYKDLSVKIPPTLTLPYKYKLLENMFKSADTVVSIMYNRLERCTFTKLKRSVQDMIRKNFEPRHLGQIKAVYPESYHIRQEKGVVEAGMRSNKHHMTIEPVIDVDENSTKITKRKDGRPVFSNNEVVKRKENFRGRLFNIVKDHHQRFLEAMAPPMKVDSSKVTRWHPKFLLDNVPDVEPAELPLSPDNPKELVTAKDVLDAARGKLPFKVQQALQKVADASEKANNRKNLQKTAAESNDNIGKGTSIGKQTPPAASVSNTSRISSSLLERIRAKEALKAQAAMLRDESTENEIDLLGRLPEMMKILRSFFVTERKTTLTEDSVIIKLCDSYKSAISQSSVEKHIEYLLKVLPEWISRVSVSSGKYIKINKEAELTQLNKKISQVLKQKQYFIPK